MERKGVVRGQEGERERERETDRRWLRKGCGMGHKLDHWSSINEGYRVKDNPRVYQDGQKAYPKNF